MGITGGGGSSPYRGGVLNQQLDIYSRKIAVHSDCATLNVPRNVHHEWIVLRKARPSQAAVSGDVVFTSCEQESARM